MVSMLPCSAGCPFDDHALVPFSGIFFLPVSYMLVPLMVLQALLQLLSLYFPLGKMQLLTISSLFLTTVFSPVLFPELHTHCLLNIAPPRCLKFNQPKTEHFICSKSFSFPGFPRSIKSTCWRQRPGNVILNYCFSLYFSTMNHQALFSLNS